MTVSLKQRVNKILADSYKYPIVIIYSGVADIGKNSYLVAKNGKILIVDFGIGFPDISAYGIQGFIPNVEFFGLVKNNIAGIVLTHAHLDHVGGLEYLLQTLPNNLAFYGSRFTIEFISEKLKRIKKEKKLKFNIVNSGDLVKIKNFEVNFAHVTHSIPHSMMVGVNTQFGKIVYTGDYKFDDTPINERPTDIHIIEQWAKQGILSALLDSTNAFEQGHSKSETAIMGVLEKIIGESRGRVIIGMFSSLVSRMIGIIEIAKKLNKKVAFTGRSMEQNIKIAKRIGYLVADRDVIIPISEISKYDDKQVVILATGSQGEHMAALTRMARGKHEKVKLKSTDTVILSASVIPTNVVDVQQLMDLLAYTGVRVINSKLMDVHVSGHAYQEEMVEMAYLLKAKYYIPVHGYPSFLFQHKRLLVENGISSNKIFVPTEGAVYAFPNGRLVTRKKLDIYPYAIVDNTLLSSHDPLLENRKVLGANGIIVLTLQGRILKNVMCIGVFPKAKKNKFRKEILSYVNSLLKQKFIVDNVKITTHIIQGLARFLSKEYNISPLIKVNYIR